MLKASGYKYWQEVFWHGQVQGVYSTPELLLLNEADLSVDANGNLVGVAMRLSDIGMRYGFGSDEYNGAKELAKKLGLGKMMGHNCLTICVVVANRVTEKFSIDYHPYVRKLVLNTLERLSAK
jgi:hypothetical protein